MSSKVLVIFVIFSLFSKLSVGGKCKKYLSQRNFQLISDYANLRNIKHIILIEENIKLGCNFKSLKNNSKNLGKNKVYLSMLSSVNAFDTDVNRKAMVITFCKNYSQENLMDQANKLTRSGGTVSWLMILTTKQKYILDDLRFANFSLDVDVVIAVDTHWTRTGSYSQDLNNTRNNLSTDDDKLSTSYDKFIPFLNNGNVSSYNLDNYCQNESIILEDSYCMLQIYKIRRLYNTSLVVHPLGFWQLSFGTKYMQPFLNTEQRCNFFHFPLIFGHKNSTQRNAIEIANEEIDDDKYDDNMEEFISYFSSILNASTSIVTHPKIGSKDNNGEWTDLIGAIIKEDVDVGVDTIVSTRERTNDMTFSYEIMTYVRNIYIQPQESNDLRDIFLRPFDSRLILCVVAVIAILVIVMTIYGKIILSCRNLKTANRANGFLDSVIWCIGIFTQQGSIWTPRSLSEQIIMIVSLAFTLLIYNSYSAFITSILSVKRWDIRTVEDLLDSNYEIGYTRNSQDELYLRSMNVTQLNQIYLRGYLHNNINNVTEGLLKASKGNYAFFASGHVARKELRVISNYRCIYDIAEIPVPHTVNHIAFPMSKNSPYKKLINLNIIRMYESGIYEYISPLLKPNLQLCDERRTYQSAGIPDLTAAFGILIVGQILSIAIVIGECIWKRKRELYASLKKNIFHGKSIAREPRRH